MPGCGFHTLRERKDPIVDRLMTGGVSTLEARRFLEELGTTRWVTKPISMPDLRRLVVELGRSRGAHQEGRLER